MNRTDRRKQWRNGMNKLLGDRNKSEFLKGKLTSVFDETLIHREVYNPNNFDLIFQRNKEKDSYVIKAGITLGPETIICKPDDFCYLTHGYYICSGRGIPVGTPISHHTIYGDSMFTGEKKISLPAT